ncbi:MAG: DUF5683 domain-containing protein [Bacteroidota bacterium]
MLNSDKIISWPVLSLIVILITGPGNFAVGQIRRDSSRLLSKSLESEHSPKKALLMAALLPGSGQAYNHKYWKIPIVYAGYGAAGYFLQQNQKNYKDSKRNYIFEIDGIDSTVNQSGKTKAQLLTDIDSYRRYRDISVLALLAWHGLTIIDANVDAHFFNWDVNEDLSLYVRPRALWLDRNGPGLGMCLTFNLK